MVFAPLARVDDVARAENVRAQDPRRIERDAANTNDRRQVEHAACTLDRAPHQRRVVDRPMPQLHSGLARELLAMIGIPRRAVVEDARAPPAPAQLAHDVRSQESEPPVTRTGGAIASSSRAIKAQPFFPKNSPIADTTRSISCGRSRPWIGNDRTRPAVASALGKDPAPLPSGAKHSWR